MAESDGHMDKEKQDRRNAIAKAQRVAARDKVIRDALKDAAYAHQYLTKGIEEIGKLHETDRADRAAAEKEDEPWRDEVAVRVGCLTTDLRIAAVRLLASMDALEPLPPELP